MTTALPEGIVTFLFTDIEGSTRLLHEVGDAAYGETLGIHRTIVDAAAGEHGGVRFGSEGDAVFVAFASAAGAIRAAVAAQRALAAYAWRGGDVRVRMGIHTGEVLVVGGDYVGIEVHRAARVAAAAHGGQIIVTDATRTLAGEPDGAISMRDAGEHRLKDFPRPERLYQVVADGLETAFPPLKTLDLTPNNLPPQLTTFVGRAEVDNAVSLLDRTRLLTLTGPGGTGKTRLSLALAGDCIERFPDGTWFVPLAPVTDPELVASAIAASIGLLAPQRPPIERVKEHLRERTALLVLDNFEQVVSGAPIVADLLRSAPRLTVIVSSRAPLRISGEQEFPVPPLALPPAGTTDVETLLAAEAVRLFVERAMAVRPDFMLTPENGPHVAEVVRRLDGLPLAIELAAARIRLLSPAAMAQRLGDRLGLLSAGARDLPERQRTLRGAIDWSHELLEAEDRRLFARLGVFAGGGPLETAEAVCGIAGDEVPLDVLGGLERLAEQSLVRIGDDLHGDVRFTMLETIREYALDKLAERGEADALRDRHADAFLAFATTSRPQAIDTTTAAAAHARLLDRLEDEHDNLRTALEHLTTAGDTGRASDLVFVLWRFWQMRGHLFEGRTRVDRVLAMPGWTATPTRARLRTLEAAGGLAYWAADAESASAHYGAAVEMARLVGDDAELANALYNFFFARRPAKDSEEWFQLIRDGDTALLDEALEIWTRLGDEHGMGRALWGLSEYHDYRGEAELGEAAATRALEIFERIGDPFWVSWSRFTRAFGRLLSGDVQRAAADLAPTVREFWASRDLSGVTLVMSATAIMLLHEGRDADAYRVGGAERRLVAETGIHLASRVPLPGTADVDPDTSDPRLQAALAEGASWTRDEAVDHVLAFNEALGREAPTRT
ncbi:MAG TPA: adenylate/guanylate cyclase domain-containing protein [Candidatus Limnocylindrales bacterium]